MTLYNKRHGAIPTDAVWIDRKTKWGNPFVIGRDGTRDDVIAKYKHYLHHDPRAQHLRDSIDELVDQDLICWCAPSPCHGDVIINYIRSTHHV